MSAANPRPAQAICEQCHWPKKYVGNVERTYQHYLSDEKNTPFAVRLLLNVGGGDPSNGPQGGIHWHMNIANKIEYIATDDKFFGTARGLAAESALNVLEPKTEPAHQVLASFSTGGV